jgi:hypothetical protein
MVSEVVLRIRSYAVPVRPVGSDRPKFYYKSPDTWSMQNLRFELKKPAGVFRIAAVGDSFTAPHLIQFAEFVCRVGEAH